jgi:site-specific DNA-cytosine methylase
VRILVACEYSGRVRQALRARGHDAWSCDLLPAEDSQEFHLQCDVRDVPMAYDLMIAHPPCTHLAVSGARWFKEKAAEQAAALEFVRWLMDVPIPRICIENPVSIISSAIRPADQVIQPWQFGEGEVKTTCLWLKGLPKLIPTHKEGGDMFTDAAPSGRVQRCWLMPPGPDRWKERSRTYQGIADAMAAQWTVDTKEKPWQTH